MCRSLDIYDYKTRNPHICFGQVIQLSRDLVLEKENCHFDWSASPAAKKFDQTPSESTSTN